MSISKLHEIPIVAVGNSCQQPVPAGSVNAAALALLGEIGAKLEALANDSEESSIDLRCLAGMPEDLALLRETLGQGEVSATVANIGNSHVQETAVPCVWWVSYRDLDGSRIGEFVEIPSLLRSDRLSIPLGLAELRRRCDQLSAPDPLSP